MQEIAAISHYRTEAYTVIVAVSRAFSRNEISDVAKTPRSSCTKAECPALSTIDYCLI